MSISAADVKKLRDMTGAGMLDCKNALKDAGGDIEAAVTALRKAGQAKAGKKADREANEGLCAAKTEGNVGTLVQLQCETDFVAKTDKFKDYLSALVEKTAATGENGDVTDAINGAEKDDLINMIATIGENMKIAKAIRWESNGACASYLHANGRVGVLVDVEGEYDDEILKHLCMHIAAFSPSYVTSDEVPADVVEKERDIAAEKAKGKPPEIVEKIVGGVINKWYKEVCLVDQAWIMDDKSTLAKIAPNLKVKRFARLQTGA